MACGGLLRGERVEVGLGLGGGVAGALGPRQRGLGLLLLRGRVGAQGGEVVLEGGEAGLLGGEPVHRLALHVHHRVDQRDPVGELLGVGARQGHVELAEALLLVDLGGELGDPGAAARDRLGRGAELVLGLLLAGPGGLELLRGHGVGPVGGGGGVLRLLEHGAGGGQLVLGALQRGVGGREVGAGLVELVLEPVDLGVDPALVLARVGAGGHRLGRDVVARATAHRRAVRIAIPRRGVRAEARSGRPMITIGNTFHTGSPTNGPKRCRRVLSEPSAERPQTRR